MVTHHNNKDQHCPQLNVYDIIEVGFFHVGGTSYSTDSGSNYNLATNQTQNKSSGSCCRVPFSNETKPHVARKHPDKKHQSSHLLIERKSHFPNCSSQVPRRKTPPILYLVGNAIDSPVSLPFYIDSFLLLFCFSGVFVCIILFQLFVQT